MDNSIKVGVLIDYSTTDVVRDTWTNVLQFAIDEYAADGRFTRPITVVARDGMGTVPGGTHEGPVQAWQELRDEGVMVVLGGCAADNLLVLGPSVARDTLPTVGITATMPWFSEYAFNVPWGSESDCPFLMASWLAKNDHTRVAVTYDHSPHSEEYIRFFRIAARRYGIKILCQERVGHRGPRIAQEAAEVVALAQSLEPDALVDMSVGAGGAVPIVRAVAEAKWDIPRLVGGQLHNFYIQPPDDLAIYEGWVGCSTWDDDNTTMANFLERYTKEYGTLPGAEFGAVLYDAARAIVEGLMLAPIMSREGVKAGLEQVRMLPAAQGDPRTVIGFGPYDHRGISSADLMVLRRVVNGEAIMEGKFEY